MLLVSGHGCAVLAADVAVTAVMACCMLLLLFACCGCVAGSHRSAGPGAGGLQDVGDLDQEEDDRRGVLRDASIIATRVTKQPLNNNTELHIWTTFSDRNNNL